MAGSDVRIVLLGKTGVGKSATGNTILGTEEFVVERSPASVTRQCKKFETKVSGRKVVVVDTPGLFDTSFSNDEMKEAIVECVKMTVPGPHVFLLVIRLGVRFTQEEQTTMKWIQENFSKLALKYSLVLFTGGDDVEDLEDYIEKSPELSQLISECGGRYHTFDNTKNDRAQVTRLLAKIDRMVKANGGQHYTDKMYLEAQRKIKDEEERIRREEEMKRQEEERKIQEEQRKKEEATRKEWERQEKQRRDEDRKRFEEEKRQRLEEEKKKFEEEKRQRLEEERKKREEDRKEYERRREEDRKGFEEQERKRRKEESQSRKAEKEEWERKEQQRIGEERKRLDEERKKREEDKKEYERRREEDRKRSEEQERKRREEEEQRREEWERRRGEEKREEEKRREEDRKRIEEQERRIREEEKKRQEERERKAKKNNPLAFLGKIAMSVPALVGGAAVGLVEAVVDVPVGMFKGGEKALSEGGHTGITPGAIVDAAGGEIKGAVGAVANAPAKVFDRAMDGVTSLWK